MNFELNSLEVSSEIMDEEHLRFVYMINNFYIAYNNNENHDFFLDLLDDLESYAIAHFQTEEIYYRKFHLANIELKFIKNQLLIEKIEEFRNKFVTLQVDKKELLEFLFNWLMAHFKEHDIRFDNFLKNNNLDFLYQLSSIDNSNL